MKVCRILSYRKRCVHSITLDPVLRSVNDRFVFLLNIDWQANPNASLPPVNTAAPTPNYPVRR
jgi:hypothetical protein